MCCKKQKRGLLKIALVKAEVGSNEIDGNNNNNNNNNNSDDE